MIKVSIFALALVAGLAALANAQEKDAKYFENMLNELHGKMANKADSFAEDLGFELLKKCDESNKRNFAMSLENLESSAYRCVTEKLAKPKTLIDVIQHVPEMIGKSLLEYLGDIPTRSIRSEREASLRRLISQSEQLCREYDSEFAPFFAEAEGSEFAYSNLYAQELLARNACKVYLQNRFTSNTITEAGKLAGAKSRYEKTRSKF